MSKHLLVTGAAGFIGAHAMAALADDGWKVLGVDNFNAYYAPQLKHDRVAALLKPRGLDCTVLDICNADAVHQLFERHEFTHVLHLAAQAGVRHSIAEPHSYLQSNLVGFGSILDASKQFGVQHLVYASSSSVYGARNQTPFKEDDDTTHPTSLYAASKRANELMADAYAHLFQINCTGLRFFTVYGPWGRPDMAYFSFAQKMRAGNPITVFAEGKLQRDFTYIADIVEALRRILNTPPPLHGQARPHAVCNIGNRNPVSVMDFVQMLEQALGICADIQFAPMQPGDVPITCADTTRLKSWTGFEPNTSLQAGLNQFASWLKEWEHA